MARDVDPGVDADVAGDVDADVAADVERAARDGYGRLVAWLASRCRNLSLAEDAVADALEAALVRWPESGVPDNPEAWLLSVARRRMIDRMRRDRTRRDKVEALTLEAQEAADTGFRAGLPDRRLELLLVCAHPEIPAPMRTPLMLQTVLGLPADRIASALLVRPSTMGQRLSRVKRRIKDAKLTFELPAEGALHQRMGYVLDAIYVAYGTGWESTEIDSSPTGLASEALWLTQLVVRLAPEAAEAKGLLALMLYCESRRSARRSPEGAFVPLDEQDTARWDHELILEAEKALWLAARQRRPGPFQVEAAIQSLHAHRARSGMTDWRGVHQLYQTLATHYPSVGARIGLAASCGRIGEPARGLDVLEEIDERAREHHQPYWAVRAHLLATADRPDEARDAYGRAIGLTDDPAVRRWLMARRAELGA